MFKDRILNLTKRLYPRGRAFHIPFGSTIEKIHKGLAISENNAYTSALSLLDSILPDNDNFTSEDASNWERRLGLITSQFISLDDRKAAILRKINHPGTIKARQHYLYLQKMLRDANFDVYVHENRFLADPMIDFQMGASEMGVGEMGGEQVNPDKYEVIDPNDLLLNMDQMGISEMGVGEMGGTSTSDSFEVVANHIEPELDENYFVNADDIYQMGTFQMGNEAQMGYEFDYVDSLRSTFFVGGMSLGSFANIPLDRKKEFRQLILKVKPVQTIGFLFVNYLASDFNDDFSLEDFNA
jgi:hypothetical protein